MPGITISNHAYDRAKERLGFDKKATDKMAVLAYGHGTKHGDAKGRLKKYIDKLFLEHRTANNTRVYGEAIYLFHNQTLITIYRLPNNLKKLASISKS